MKQVEEDLDLQPLLVKGRLCKEARPLCGPQTSRHTAVYKVQGSGHTMIAGMHADNYGTACYCELFSMMIAGCQ